MMGNYNYKRKVAARVGRNVTKISRDRELRRPLEHG